MTIYFERRPGGRWRRLPPEQGVAAVELFRVAPCDGWEARCEGAAVATVEMPDGTPPCDVCGSITVRSGLCFKCLNCGNAMGVS